jgi:hypothetical protein
MFLWRLIAAVSLTLKKAILLMSMKLTAQAMELRVGNPLRKLVLLKLCDNANDKGICWPSVEYVANQCEISVRSVMNHIRDLEAAGFLRVMRRSTSGKKISNMYLITLDAGAQKQADSVQNIEQVEVPPEPENGDFFEFSSESPAHLNSVSSASAAGSSAGAAYLSSAGAAHKPVIQPVIEPVNKKIYKKISLDRLPPEISTDLAVEFIELRERLKKPLTQGAFDRSMREALRGSRFGLAADEVIRECVDAGWRGIKVQWVLNRRGAGIPQQGVAVARPIATGGDTRTTPLAQQLSDTSWAK